MLKNSIIIFTSLLLLSGCADGFKGYFKKSANNKWIDTKGFHGGKRKPLYNKKYISIAKRNIVEENFDDDDEELDHDDIGETESVTRTNRDMYIEMINQDAKRKKRLRLEQYKKSFHNRGGYASNNDYPSINEASERVNSASTRDQDVQMELAEIKQMLNEARKDLTKYKCPLDSESTPKKPINNPKPLHKKSINRPKDITKKSDAELKEKFSEENDDFKQTNLKSHERNIPLSHEI